MGAPQEHEGGEGFVEAVFDDVRDFSLGVKFEARGDGVAVGEVVPGSRASRVAGLHAGMVLIGVYGKDGRGRSISGLDYLHVMELIKNKKACDHVKLRFAASSESRPHWIVPFRRREPVRVCVCGNRARLPSVRPLSDSRGTDHAIKGLGGLTSLARRDNAQRSRLRMSTRAARASSRPSSMACGIQGARWVSSSKRKAMASPLAR